jgi:radical SAM protein with 4Fe4S-binding SPASM domain
MPAFPERASGIESSDNAHVASLFKEAAARSASHYLESGIIELAYASRLCYAFANDRRRRYICTAGIDKFTIMTDGDVMPCYLVCDSVHKISSCKRSKKASEEEPILEGVASKYRALAREHLLYCSQCWASDWCFACYGPGYARNRCLGSPGGLECEIYRAMVEATLFECARFLINKGKMML